MAALALGARSELGLHGSCRTDPLQLLQTIACSNHGRLHSRPDRGHDRRDMIEAISGIYGPNAKPSVRPTAGSVGVQSRIEIESGTPVARWGDTEHAVVLYRVSTYREAFRLIVTDLAVADLDRKGTIEALRLDEQDAPRREIARQKKERDDAQGRRKSAKREQRTLHTLARSATDAPAPRRAGAVR